MSETKKKGQKRQKGQIPVSSSLPNPFTSYSPVKYKKRPNQNFPLLCHDPSSLSFLNGFQLNSDSPGPGRYSVSLKPSGPSFSIYGKLTEKNRNSTPGPGTYIILPPKVVCTKFSPIALQTSQNFLNNLGPGHYSPLETITGPRWGFGRSQRPDLVKSESPGPGSYEVIQKNKKKTGFSLFSRRDRYEKNNSPGPGSYTPKICDGSLKFSLGIKREVNIREPIPGPGTYLPSVLDYSYMKSERNRKYSRYRKNVFRNSLNPI